MAITISIGQTSQTVVIQMAANMKKTEAAVGLYYFVLLGI